MYAIDVSTATQTRPASTPQGTPGWYTDGNPSGGNPATIVPAEWLNMVQDELINILKAANITPNKAIFNQLSLALQFGMAGLGVDTGTANNYLVNLASAPAALADGMIVMFKAHAANTGASTMNLNGLGAFPLLGEAQAPLQGNEIALGGFVRAVWSASLNSWVLNTNTGGALQVGTATASRHAITMAQFQAGVGRYAVDTGAANAYAVALNPVPPAPVDGFAFAFKAANANTGASTLNLNGQGAQPLIGTANAPLQGGEIVANGEIGVVWSASAAAWVVVSNTGGAQQVGAASQSNHAPRLSQMVGRLLAIQVFSASGTYTPTAGTTHVRVRCCGGGAGGGGCAATGATQISLGAGGTSAMYIETWLGNVGVQSVTIGAPGVGGGPGVSGAAGGTTALGGIISMPGGVGGYGGAAGQFPASIPPPAPPTGGTFGGTVIVYFRGASGGTGVVTSQGAGVSGSGGQCPLGGAVGGVGMTANGRTQNDPGGGGSGAVSTQNAGGYSGGNGGPGWMIIEDYA